MSRVFLLLSDVNACEEAELAAAFLSESGKFAGAAVLGSFPWRLSGVEVVSVPFRNLIDIASHRTLRDAIASSQAEVVHAFGDWATLILSLMLRLPRIGIVPAPKIVACGVDLPKTSLIVRMAFRRANRVVASTKAEATRLAAWGIASEKIFVVPPGIPTSQSHMPSTDGVEFRRKLGIPPTARLILASGNFERAAEMKTAVWAFDIVKYCLGDIYLLLVGDGPESARVERFVKAVAFDDNRVRFAGSSIDRHDAVHLADQVWIIGRNEVGFALSAMAAGKPILGMYDEDIAEIVSDSGRLVGSRDRVALAAASLDLLNDRASADRLGEAGRDRVEREFSHESRARSLAALYDSMSFSTDRINA